LTIFLAFSASGVIAAFVVEAKSNLRRSGPEGSASAALTFRRVSNASRRAHSPASLFPAIGLFENPHGWRRNLPRLRAAAADRANCGMRDA
jgi:hypothetical protein